jgi:hypothetical protein
VHDPVGVDGHTLGPSALWKGVVVIHVQNGAIVDSSGNPILLRGFVSITNNTDGSPVSYTLADYQRMQSLGANMQAIRLGAGSLAAWPNQQGEPGYVDRLALMVAHAKQAGLFSAFKFTMYDVQGSNVIQVNQTWNQCWNIASGAQDAVLAGWKNIWQRFATEPFVFGYDLLNEPEQGTLNLDDNTFATQHLNPFYAKAIKALRSIDSQHLAFIQPPVQANSYTAPVGVDQILYAPHFYPDMTQYLAGQFVTTGYQPLLQRYQSEAAIQKAPLYIGEYSMPVDLSKDDDPQYQQQYIGLEQTALNLFTHNKLPFSRPWFADDGSAISLAGGTYGWGVIKGANLTGPFRQYITNTFQTAVKG